MPEMERPIFLSGKVVLDDGTPPPDSVVIERVCNGMPRPEGYTDSKGRFSFELGRNTALIPDASVSAADDRGEFGSRGSGFPSSGGGFGQTRGMGTSSEQRLMGCELRASLPGFRSSVVQLTGRRIMDNPDVGTIILHRLGNVEGTTISATSMLAPKDAKKAYEKGSQANRKRKWQDAQKQLAKAVELYPKYAAAWFELGVAHQGLNNVEEARKAYEQSLASDAKYLKPYMRLAEMSFREQKWQEVADTTDRLLRLDPVDFPHAYLFNSIANFSLRKLDVAEKSAREGLKLDPEHRIPKLEHVLGVILANKQDYPTAAQHMRNYLTHAPQAGDADTVRKQLSEIERMTGAPQASAPAAPQPQQ
jgi:tetratricopeptide (TPR) repeat protein